jgi:hydrogenase small subunit
MLIPPPPIWRDGETLGEQLGRAGYDRRDLLRFAGRMAALFAAGPLLPGQRPATAQTIAARLTETRKPSAVWLQLQECTGCLESTLRAGHTSIEELILNLISLNYCELVMAASGQAANAALDATNKEPHLLVVNGSIPTLNPGYCTIGGKSTEAILRDAAANATAILAVGACAFYGCVQAAAPNPTGAVGVQDILTNREVVNVAGCPPIPEVITATIVYVLTYGRTPPVDSLGRPLFAYGARIHDNCPRRAHYDAGQFVTSFGDDASREGHCLAKVGCKGPDTFAPCPVIKWNMETSFPIQAGHPCLGCTEPHWFDRNTPFYRALPHIPGMGVESTANKVGAVALAAVGAGIAAHSVATAIRRRLRSHREDALASAPGDVTPSED